MKQILLKSVFVFMAFHSLAQTGIVDVAPAITDGLSRFEHGIARVQENGKLFYIDTTGKYLFDKIIDTKESTTDGLEVKANVAPTNYLLVSSKDKMGVLSLNGKWILQPIYESIETNFKEAWKLTQKGKTSWFNNSGLLLPFEFDDAGWLDGVHFDVKQNGKWGVYSAVEKKLVIPLQYDGFDYCGGCGNKSDYVYAMKGDKWGIVSFQNKVLIPFEYSHEHYFMRSDSWVLAFQKNGGKVVVHIPSGKEYNHSNYEAIELLGNGLLALKKGKKYGAVNAQGVPVLDFIYDKIEAPNQNHYTGNYYGDYAIVTSKNKKGIVDADGKIIVPVNYEDIKVYEDFFVTTNNGKQQLLDKEKNVLIQPGFYDITHLNDYYYSSGSKGLNIFKIKEKALYGLYFADIKKWVPPTFYELKRIGPRYDKEDRWILGEYKGKSALYNFAGEELVPLKYEVMSLLADSILNLFVVETASKKGLYDAQLKKELIPAVYDNIQLTETNPNLLIAKNDPYGSPEFFVYDISGKLLLPGFKGSKEIIGDNNWLLHDVPNNRYSIFNTASSSVNNLPFSNAWPTNVDGLLLVTKKNEPVGQLYDVAAAKLLPGKYSTLGYYNYEQSESDLPVIATFQSGLARVEKNGKIGFINTKEKWIIPAEYDVAATHLTNGVVTVGKRLSKKADEEEYVVVQPETESKNKADAPPVETITDRHFGNRDEIKYGFADSTGKMIVPLDYDYKTDSYGKHYILENGYLVLYKKKKEDYYNYLTGLANKTGTVLIAPEYDNIWPLKSGKGFIVMKDRKLGFVNNAGKIIIPTVLDDIYIGTRLYGNEESVDIQFPLLTSADGVFKYYTADGKILPVTSNGYLQFYKFN